MLAKFVGKNCVTVFTNYVALLYFIIKFFNGVAGAVRYVKFFDFTVPVMKI